MSPESASNKTEWIERLIIDFIGYSTENTLKNLDNNKAFETPLIGFSRGNDPLYESYKGYVGPFHWTPVEIFNLTFPDIEVDPEELTIISWVLPHIEKTRSDNRKESIYPAERWARGRIYGEEVNVKLRNYVVEALLREGYEAVAPAVSSNWSRKTSEKYGFASTWSERHAAYASGLGTFSLNDGLITPKGIAMRVGSAVARIKIPSTPRPYTDHHDYCLFFTHGICGECIRRCPAGAIDEKGHDKIKCRRHVHEKCVDYIKTQYKFDGLGCGLCQTGVPCESKIPTEKDVNNDF